MEKAMEMASKAANNNTVINVFLAALFVGLNVRSASQQSKIEALESEKDSLLKSNKSIKQTLWKWKQQLYADASSSSTPLIPLARLQSIYGDVPTTPSAAADSEKKVGKASAQKIMI